MSIFTMNANDLVNYLSTLDFNPSNPDNIRLFHGTTKEAVISILKDGYWPDITVWNCSYNDYMYCYEWERFKECESMEEDEDKYILNRILGRANEAAQIANAIQADPDDYTYVIEFIIPPELREAVEPDDSYEYKVGEVESCQIKDFYLNALLKSGKLSVRIYSAYFAKKCALMYIASCYDNEYFQSTLERLPASEQAVLEVLSKNFLDNFFDEYVLCVDVVRNFRMERELCKNFVQC